MLHEPAAPQEKDYAIAYKTRVGVWMFLAYAIVYAGFVIINVSRPLWMEAPVMLGLNLAVTYGFGLILFALLLALVYTRMCSKKEAELNSQAREDG